MNVLVRWIVAAIAVWLAVWLGDKIGIGLEWMGFGKALIFVLVLALLNTLVRPIVLILINLFAMPLNCLTMGLFGLVSALILNVLFFWWAANLTGGLKVDGFLAAFFGSVVVSVASGAISGLACKATQPREN